jgi:Transposase, Mutator family
MGKPTSEGECPHDGRAATLGELIHEAVHRAIELAVEEEPTAVLGAARYGRDAVRAGYRNGRRARTLTGPTGLLALTLPRATLFAAGGAREWTSTGRPLSGYPPELVFLAIRTRVILARLGI